MSNETKKITPPNRLKRKVGSGGIPLVRIERAESLVEDSDIGFGEYVEEQILILDGHMNAFNGESALSDKGRLELTKPVMTLKAHGAMFGYKIISNVAHEILNLLETSNTLNVDLLEILGAFKTALRVIVKQEIKSTDSVAAEKILHEINHACTRYFAKYNG